MTYMYVNNKCVHSNNCMYQAGRLRTLIRQRPRWQLLVLYFLSLSCAAGAPFPAPLPTPGEPLRPCLRLILNIKPSWSQVPARLRDFTQFLSEVSHALAQPEVLSVAAAGIITRLEVSGSLSKRPIHFERKVSPRQAARTYSSYSQINTSRTHQCSPCNT